MSENSAVSGNVRAPSAELSSQPRLIWNVKKLVGGQELTNICKVSLSTGVKGRRLSRRDFDQITLTFEIPMFNTSGLQVKYLRISDVPGQPSQASPYRWVRYVTHSGSYVCRLT